VIGVVLWAIFLLGRLMDHDGSGILSTALELVGMDWMANVFLIFVSMLLLDLITLFGFLLPRFRSILRGGALITGLLLSFIALIQGMRPPVITEYEVILSDLPKSLDGTVIIGISDMHLGSLLGKEWLTERVNQVQEQQPDMIVLLGDIFEGHGPSEEQFTTIFKQLSAPLGIWAVSGNHDSNRDNDAGLFERSGFRTLNNKWVEVKPGLVLSGVDNLNNRGRNRQENDPISVALLDRPVGATIFLSHSPLPAERLSEAGVELMLSAHTHGGQIWPFNYLVRTRYPLLEGRYQVNSMTLLICRGTGTWGPRMRLWRPGEILRVILRARG